MLSLLSRLLLCLCLLVDTVAPAMAATHLARASAPASQTPATPATAAMPAMPAAHGDCHDIDTEARAAPAAPAAPASPSPMDGDCLERCLELCLQHGVATLPAAAPMAHPADAAPVVSADATQLAHAHAFPPLRPPIG
ncbi:CopL family metal-binding regulatory protein [Luteimonas sp. M1R5S18]|uniref:CopL family metal-binding regulatory protein n=1 Tax=Luteimonas rhizosphaericola TaxID=3042024 RepID=A0ABT6JLT5_9GAMM|nr:CopL family metal-binding regulatory protein [Luteimonas rhizosphaericola]MDH5831633.1 CopL family metal-binding regulatory protein [Luteimonas rhizosphaericola]